MTEFTPGPYKSKKAAIPVDGEYDYAVIANINGAPHVIGEAFGRVDKTVLTPAKANAAMFAASYDMYWALKQAREAFIVAGSMALSDADLVGVIDAVIAKAEGRT